MSVLVGRRRALDLLGGKVLRNLHLAVAQLLELADELARVVEVDNRVRAADADAVDHDVGHRAAARQALEHVLQVRADVEVGEAAHADGLVKLHDKGLGLDDVLFEEDALGALRVRAVCFRKDDDCVELACGDL